MVWQTDGTRSKVAMAEAIPAMRGDRTLEQALHVGCRVRHLLPVVVLRSFVSLACNDPSTNPACADPGTPHDEVIEVSASQFPSEAAACFSSQADCRSLCDVLARSRGTGGRVLVSVCDRVAGQDGGTLASDGDAPDGGNSPDQSRAVRISYRTFPFCGT